MTLTPHYRWFAPTWGRRSRCTRLCPATHDTPHGHFTQGAAGHRRSSLRAHAPCDTDMHAASLMFGTMRARIMKKTSSRRTHPRHYIAGCCSGLLHSLRVGQYVHGRRAVPRDDCHAHWWQHNHRSGPVVPVWYHGPAPQHRCTSAGNHTYAGDAAVAMLSSSGVISAKCTRTHMGPLKVSGKQQSQRRTPTYTCVNVRNG